MAGAQVGRLALAALVAAVALLLLPGCRGDGPATPPPPPPSPATPSDGPASTPSSAAPGRIEFLDADAATDKAPRLSGDWVAWTRDAQERDSWGTIVARQLGSGRLETLGPGFLPDVDVYARDAGEGTGDGASEPVVRIAWLRFEEDRTLSVVSATRRDAVWTKAVLARGLGLAGEVSVAGELTAFTATDAEGTLRVHLHDGRETHVVSAPGVPAFRPSLARSEGGAAALVWDAYVGGPDRYDYEVFGCFREPGAEWSAPVNLSAAPGSMDLGAALAPAADGGWWLAWESNRGTLLTRAFAAHRAPNGALTLPQPHPPSSEPARLGILDLTEATTPNTRPALAVDGRGRPWVIVETKTLGAPQAVFDKRLIASVYDGASWSAPVVLPGQRLGETAADAAPTPDGIRVVYQIDAAETGTADIATTVLDAGPSAAGPLLRPADGPPDPAGRYPSLQLPAERELLVGGVPHLLLFADLHSHTGQSGDGLGELDQALLWARDVVHLDVWASTDHDSTHADPYLDWQYELARRLVASFDTPAFTTLMGFEWSNHAQLFEGEIIGHRATIASDRCYRYSDPEMDELSEYYAAMRAEDAIGVPHHLGKFGGSTFRAFDPVVQPVTEVSSVHGQFEDALVAKLKTGVRFGVTAAGDDHLSMPGIKGIAGVFVDTTIASREEALLQGLRDRRCFGVRRHGFYADLRLDGQPMGAAFTHAGDLLLRVRVAGIPTLAGVPARPPGEGEVADDAPAPAAEAGVPVHVNVSRNGEYAEPVYSRIVKAGDTLDDLVVLPGSAEDAFYMLRVTRGAVRLDPENTLLWSSPIWVDAEAPDGYPRVSIGPPRGSRRVGTPLELVLGLQDPEGLEDLVELRLHVTDDGRYVETLELSLPRDGATTLTHPLPALEPGTWGYVLEVRDRQGHVAVAGTALTITP